MDWLADQPHVQEAAQIGYLFKVRPSAVLRSDWWSRQVDAAGAKHIGRLMDGKLPPDALDPSL